ncbi:MAG: serine/threonine-protein kinase [Terriglobia bacterium]
MDQSCGLDRPGIVATHVVTRNSLELPVDQRDQPVQGRRLSGAPSLQERRDFLTGNTCRSYTTPCGKQNLHRRNALLESADPDVRSEVEGLLSSTGSESSPLDRDVLSHAGALLADETESRIQAGERANLGQYEIQALLGRGGMGEVYLAHDQKLGRDVAIKTVPMEFSEDPDRLSRFRREARVLASLNHPNIAAIHGLEESAGVTFLILELVEGETLAQRLKRSGPMPVEEALRVMNQVAEGDRR